MRIQRITWSLLLSCLLLAVTQAATTFERMSLEQLASRADLAVRVRCIGNDSRWIGGEIWTFSTFESLETLKGLAPTFLTVKLLGGRVGHLASRVDGVPRFQTGEEVVLFLERARSAEFTVTSWAQGTFRVHRDSRTGRALVTQDTSAHAIFDPDSRTFRVEGIREMPLETFRAKVHAAVEKGTRP